MSTPPKIKQVKNPIVIVTKSELGINDKKAVVTMAMTNANMTERYLGCNMLEITDKFLKCCTFAL